MCDDDDLEGVRLWFYGGTPPVDDAGQDEQEAHSSPGCAWTWAMAQHHEQAANPAPELTTA